MPLLHDLHWLKVPAEDPVLAWRAGLPMRAPAYPAESLQLVRDVDARGHLHSADSMTLVVPVTCCSTLGDRAFLVSAARTWNALPSGVRAALSLASFRQKLERALFKAKNYPTQPVVTSSAVVLL